MVCKVVFADSKLIIGSPRTVPHLRGDGHCENVFLMHTFVHAIFVGTSACTKMSTGRVSLNPFKAQKMKLKKNLKWFPLVSRLFLSFPSFYLPLVLLYMLHQARCVGLQTKLANFWFVQTLLHLWFRTSMHRLVYSLLPANWILWLCNPNSHIRVS